MAKPLTKKEQLNIKLPSRLKRRLQLVAEDKQLSMNDIVVHAINDFLDKADGSYQNADLVVDRLNQVLNSQMAVINSLNQINKKLQDD